MRGTESTRQRPRRQNTSPGTRYGYVTILELSYRYKDYRTFMCRCDCGNILHIPWQYLQEHPNISCGCMKTLVINPVTGEMICD